MENGKSEQFINQDVTSQPESQVAPGEASDIEEIPEGGEGEEVKEEQSPEEAQDTRELSPQEKTAKLREEIAAIEEQIEAFDRQIEAEKTEANELRVKIGREPSNADFPVHPTYREMQQQFQAKKEELEKELEKLLSEAEEVPMTEKEGQEEPLNEEAPVPAEKQEGSVANESPEPDGSMSDTPDAYTSEPQR